MLVSSNNFIPCSLLHDHSCAWESLLTGLRSFKRFYRFYIPFHFLPMLIFRNKQLRQKPIQTFTKTCIFYIRSLLFLATFLGMSSYIFCFFNNKRKTIAGINMSLATFLSGGCLLFEHESRRTEVFIYLLSRFFESFWNFLKRRNIVHSLPKGEFLVFAVAMGILTCMYQEDETAISTSYLMGFKRFWGKN